MTDSGRDDTEEPTVRVPSVHRPNTDDAGGASTFSDSDRFKLGTDLGRGGMAIVVNARDTRLDRSVAVKTLKPELCDDATLRGRFLDEARIQAGLTHPGVAAVYDVGTLGPGQPFYAMKKVSGRTLHQLMNARSKSDVAKRHDLLHFVDIFERVCQAVAYAHRRQTIHRDLKPGNIMVDEHGSVFVMDWGLAKRLSTDADGSSEPRTQVGEVMGTPGFMSPEQSRGLADAGDCQTDVFALGVMLYGILTGSAPFRGDSAAVHKEVLYHEPDTPRSLNSSVSRELSAICMKALEKDPRRRYVDAAELAEDVRRFREFLPVSAVRPRLIDHAVGWVQRHRILTAMAGAVLITLLVVSGVVGFREYEQRQLLDQAFEIVDRSRDEITQLETQLADMREKMRAANDPLERARLELAYHDLGAKLQIKHWEIRGVLTAIIGRTIFSPDPRATELARAQTFDLIQALLDDEDYLTARAFIRSAIDRADDRNLLEFSPDDRQKLHEALQTA
jgi:tRNA A-37 threonylcarbamoyl transferase component Bud32